MNHSAHPFGTPAASIIKWKMSKTTKPLHLQGFCFVESTDEISNQLLMDIEVLANLELYSDI